MMGGGLCWLDYNNDGWLDLFVVNSYAEGDIGAYSAARRPAAYRPLPATTTAASRTSPRQLRRRTRAYAARAASRPTSTATATPTCSSRPRQSDELLWNNGDGTFTEGARSHGVVSFGWHSGAAVADVNGDGRPDLFVAGYTEANGAIPGSTAGFPTNHLGVRDLLFLNEGNGPDGRAHFREVGAAGRHRPGAVRPLARRGVHRRERRRPAGSLRRERRGPEPALRERARRPARLPLRRGRRAARASPTRTPAWASPPTRRDALSLRQQLARPDARRLPPVESGYVRRRPDGVRDAFGTNLTGWGDSWVDLNNDGTLDLVLANGAIPVTNLAKDARRGAGARAATDGRCVRGRPRSHGLTRERTRARRRPTSTTTAASTSRSTRSAAGCCSSATRAPQATGSR